MAGLAICCLAGTCEPSKTDTCPDPLNDHTPPMITSCGTDASAVLPDNGEPVPLPHFAAGVEAVDDCTQDGGLVITQSPEAFTPVGLGDTVVTISVKDAAGHESVCVRTFTVKPGCIEITNNKTARAVRVSGTIDDVTNTVEHFSDPNYLTLETHKDIRFHIDLNMTTDAGSGKLTGVAKVKWTNHSYDIQRVQCGANGLRRDYTDREWVVNVTGDLTLASDGSRVFSCAGTPNGSDVPQPYVLHEDECTPPYSRPGLDQGRATWGGFTETGVGCNSVDKKETLPLPPGNVTGEKYHEVHLKIVPLG